jgi:hypothetical protein
MSDKIGTKISTEEINGVSIDVHVGQNGRFYLYDGEDQIAGSVTLDGARENAVKKLKRTKVKVKVHFFTRAGIPGVATGIHATNSKILARIDGEAVQVNPREKPLRPDTPNEVLDRLGAIEEETRKLAKEQRELITKHEFSLMPEVERAIKIANGD